MTDPTAPRTWRTYAEVAELFDGPVDSEWDADRDRIDQSLHDRSGVPPD
ncbi:MAG TPA: hypothetical protein VG317_06370 [Pseudonocardiaceae bacterium]|nr:hypothetical protein [Pseudonocardiaceae bacterium]